MGGRRRKVEGERREGERDTIPVSVVYSTLCCSEHSNLLNQARLAVLKKRDESVKQIVEEARLRLGKVTEDAPKYRKMLEDLIAQVYIQSYHY